MYFYSSQVTKFVHGEEGLRQALQATEVREETVVVHAGNRGEARDLSSYWQNPGGGPNIYIQVQLSHVDLLPMVGPQAGKQHQVGRSHFGGGSG